MFSGCFRRYLSHCYFRYVFSMNRKHAVLGDRLHFNLITNSPRWQLYKWNTNAVLHLKVHRTACVIELEWFVTLSSICVISETCLNCLSWSYSKPVHCMSCTWGRVRDVYTGGAKVWSMYIDFCSISRIWEININNWSHFSSIYL